MELAKLAKTAHKTQPVFYFNSVKNNKNDNYVEVTWFAVYFQKMSVRPSQRLKSNSGSN